MVVVLYVRPVSLDCSAGLLLHRVWLQGMFESSGSVLVAGLTGWSQQGKGMLPLVEWRFVFGVQWLRLYWCPAVPESLRCWLEPG